MVKKFKGFDNLEITDLLIAYRKAKSDIFWEKNISAVERFVNFERDFELNIRNLFEVLRHGDVEKILSYCTDNNFFINYPKSIDFECQDEEFKDFYSISSPAKEFDRKLKNCKITISSRIIGNFTVQAHILSALWINFIGHKYDEKLSKNSYGSRLNRISLENGCCINETKYNLEKNTSFQPYFLPYKEWQNNGLNSIEKSLEAKKNVMVFSLDLKGYYHNIDAKIISNDNFNSDIGVELDDSEKKFNLIICNLIDRWGDDVTEYYKLKFNFDLKAGLPIGLTCSKIISNIVLKILDDKIEGNLKPISYGRYVDDIFIVVDNKDFLNKKDFLRFFANKIGIDDIKNINDILGKYKTKTELKVQDKKIKTFFLNGRNARNFIKNIKQELREISSEHRLMPNAQDLILTEDNTIKKTNFDIKSTSSLELLSKTRSELSLQLSYIEGLMRDLPKEEWTQEKVKFYDFILEEVTVPCVLFNYYKYLERILNIAVSLGDFDFVYCMYKKIKKNLMNLLVSKNFAVNLNSQDIIGDINFNKYIDEIIISIKMVVFDSLIKSFGEKVVNRNFLNICNFIFGFEFNPIDFGEKVKLVILSDLANVPLKLYNRKIDKLSQPNGILVDYIEKYNLNLIMDVGSTSLSKNLTYARKDLKVISEQVDIYPFLFPTRPLNSLDISDLFNDKLYGGKISNIDRFYLWKKYVQVVSGEFYISEVELTNISQDLDESYFKIVDDVEKKYENKLVAIGTEEKKSIKVAITNFETKEEEWSYSADNKSKLTFERYERFKNLIDQVLTLKDKPDYVIFPELSIPLEWLNTLIHKMSKSKISFIAGTEYEHNGNEIYSSAYMFLHDTSFGCSSWQLIKQPKLLPAVGEDKDLQSKYGKTWKAFKDFNKPVYIHNGFCFGVMICSELQNSRARVAFQGQIDGLFILSWNRDIETFGDLIKSAALDVHSYVILVNNRKYGDSRVRVPSKNSWMRDLARLRGGDNDYVVSVSLKYNDLRDFQSRAKRWPSDSDKFKPTPEGFEISPLRRITPSQ
ncbi:reverse transcriptase domain-containing protein [Acinetobacter venetianus]|uniref:Reverse transcriptase (RNA-dependent DNA polymerase) n=1 Tax=Acinetobacter venetianus TaxID=52133 RepID=A0A150HXV9_9GAMM|nr:reverse transcriptase domain-containing protein [Acinetobacter venetianus]KXZ71995.1 Reverse transcriptase (RNA-dependent DNA polymerase) [Acinetobacter venetianus]